MGNVTSSTDKPNFKCMHYVRRPVCSCLIRDDPKLDLCDSKKHYRRIFCKLNEMRHADILADTEICCGNTSFHCHSIVLMARSSFFEKRLTRHFEELNLSDNEISRTAVIREDELEIDLIESLLTFIYVGYIYIPKQRVVEYLEGAKKWDLWSIRVSEKVNISLYSQRESTYSLYENLFTQEELLSPFIHVVESELETKIEKSLSMYCPLPYSLNEKTALPPFNFILNSDNGSAVYCHRELLVAFSEYFFAMLATSSFRECSQDQILMQEIDKSSLILVMNFMYSSKIALTDENVMRVASITGWLCRESVLFETVEEYLVKTITTENCIELMHFSGLHSLPKLYTFSSNFAFKDLYRISLTKSFCKLSPDRLCDYLSSGDLCIINELQVFRAFELWAQHRVSQDEVYRTFQQVIRIPLLTVAAFHHLLNEDPLLGMGLGGIRLPRRHAHFIERDLKQAWDYVHKFPVEMRMPRFGKAFRACCKKSMVMTTAHNCLKLLHIYSVQDVSSTVNHNSFIERGQVVTSMRLRHCCTFHYTDYDFSDYKVTVLDNIMHLIGCNSKHLSCSSITFDPTFHLWNAAIPLPEPRFGHCLVTVGDSIYVVGGFTKLGGPAKNVERLRYMEKQWTTETTLLSPTTNCTCAVWNDAIYLFLPASSGQTRALLHCYSTKLRTWLQPTPLPFSDLMAPIHFTDTIVLGENIFVFGKPIPSQSTTLVSAFNVIEETWHPCVYQLNDVGRPFVFDSRMYFLKSRHYANTSPSPSQKILEWEVNALPALVVTSGRDIAAYPELLDLSSEGTFCRTTNHPMFVDLYT